MGELTIRRPWFMPWFLFVEEDLGESTDWKGRRYRTWWRCGVFVRRSSAEAFARWRERESDG